MNYDKLLEDYFNKSTSYAYDDYKVLSWNENEGRIEVYLSYDNNYRTTFTVSVFELLAFVYSFSHKI